jgi:DMSO reductase anchor subunit
LTLLASLNNPAAAESSALLYSDYGWIYGLRLVLAFIGAGIFALFLYRSATTPGRERLMSTLVYGAFAVVLIAEVMGRFLFYAAHVKVGL